jgi:hypothetical protein
MGIQVFDAEVLPENHRMLPGDPRLRLPGQGPQSLRSPAGRTSNLPGREGAEASGAMGSGGMTALSAPSALRPSSWCIGSWSSPGSTAGAPPTRTSPTPPAPPGRSPSRPHQSRSGRGWSSSATAGRLVQLRLD